MLINFGKHCYYNVKKEVLFNMFNLTEDAKINVGDLRWPPKMNNDGIQLQNMLNECRVFV